MLLLGKHGVRAPPRRTHVPRLPLPLHRRFSIRRPLARSAIAVLAAGGLAVPVLATAGPASAATLVRTVPPVNYVALGDSYSSGLGAGSITGSSGSCDRSSVAYPQLWANAHAPAYFAFVACAGATTSTVMSTQLGALSAATTLVSITIGGNDVGFDSVMETCVLHSTSTCVSAVTTAEGEVASQLPAELDSVLAAIASRSPAAKVVVLDYPQLYDLSHSSLCIGLSTTDRTDLNQAANLLDGQIQAAAARHGDTFSEVRSAFAGHQNCDGPSSWLHAVNILDISESYHPTAAGQADGYLPAFTAAAG
jgi:lysophospholipase L1-like esterase